ncbi:hypothetical protein SAE01_46000 [Segetibacter aerophilus]|uniref:RNA polymerase sigma-70 region 2 domain-containing protein n=1 Tax=Segetibacter aerophilus TaxID=670293 RepID=A0A512BJH2_9BACT|nr:hypothetical protein SAE01_46000 [Segetibacter aerophilus]
MLNYSELTNKELFKLIADKDQQVVEYIYDKYAASLYSIILQKTNLKKDADLILTNTFITLFKDESRKCCLQNTVFTKLHHIALNLIEKGSVLYMSHSSADLPYRKVSS